MRQLAVADLTDKHLALLHDAEKVSAVADAMDWLRKVLDEEMELWETPEGGLIGFRRTPEKLWIELISGLGVLALTTIKWLRAQAAGRPIEGLVTNQRLLPVYRRMGAEAVGTYMRWKP